jgi:KDO2-lipid IV(A) lauroyltransferase
MTQEMARIFEEGIAAHPEDWHMLQRVFVADFDPDRPAAPAGLDEEMNVPASGNGRGGDPA